MLDRMTAIYGMEHEAVIEFAKLLEACAITKEALESIVEAHEEMVYAEE